MSDVTAYILMGAAGAGLGALFYGGLWLTVRSLPASRNPWLLTMTSLLARMGVVVAVFVLAARFGGWERAVCLLAGFIGARVLMVRILGCDRSPGPGASVPAVPRRGAQDGERKGAGRRG